MPDWVAFVHSRLAATGLPAAREQEIIEELAGHLEDTEREGYTCAVVQDWPAFARAIRLAEEESMRSRLRALWIPGLISGLLATVALRVVQHTGYRPQVTPSDLQPMVFYYPWFLVLPLVGAIAAFLSRRAQGGVRTRLLAAVFPSFGVLAMVCLLGPLAALGTLYKGESLAYLGLLLAQFVAVWVLLPAAGLALGALPFLGDAPKASEDDAATRATA